MLVGSCKIFVDFQMYDMPTQMIPCFEEIKEEIKKEITYWKDLKINDNSEEMFFHNALNILDGDTIRCLRISDHNTKGLTNIDGTKGEVSSWNSLTMCFGVCDKNSTANGSHGVGKYAAFKNSQIRTVFYSTRNTDGDCASIGETIWPAYSSDGNKYTGEGFLCNGCKDGITPVPLMEWVSLQPGYERIAFDFGTDKYIFGFDNSISEEEFEEQVVISSLNSFFYSFYNERLEVRCGKTLINKRTINDLIDRYREKFRKYDASNTLDYYDTLLNYDQFASFSLKFNGENDEEKDVSFYVKTGANRCNRCAVLRSSGMKVFDKKNISSSGFSAVCIIESDRATGFFRKLENDSHTDWIYTNQGVNKKEAETKKGLLFSHLKEMIKALTGNLNSEETDFDGLNEIFPLSYVLNADSRKKFEAITDKIEDITTRKRLEKKLNIKKINAKSSEIDGPENYVTAIDFIDNAEGEDIGFGPEFDPSNDHTFLPPVDINVFPPDNDQFRFGHLSNIESDLGDKHITNSPEREAFRFTNEFPPDKIRFALKKTDNNYVLRFICSENISVCRFDIKIVGDEKKNLQVTISDARLDGFPVHFYKNKIAVSNIEKNKIYVLNIIILEDGEWAFEVKTYVS